MRRRTFLASAAAAGLAMPSIAGAAGANTVRFVPQTGLSNLDPIWTTIDVVGNASLLFWDTLYGVDLGPGPRPVIDQALRELGVEVRTGATVTAVDEGGATINGSERIASNTVIWTAGLRASGLAGQVPGKHDRYGRLHVSRNLQVQCVNDVFATGDVAFAATDDAGNHAMMSCQHAMGLGRSAGHNAAADLPGLPPAPYSQPKYVTCLDLGPWGAVYTEDWEREVRMVGAAAKALKRDINTLWIYPPERDREAIFAAADPARVVVA